MANNRSPHISIGIVTYNSADDLAETLPATLTVAGELGMEVLIFDNASTDDTREVVGEHDGVRVHLSASNGGFARGVNGLFRMAGSADLLLLNPDVKLASTADVLTLHEALVESGAGVVAPRLRNPDGSIQQSARRFPTLVGLAARSTALRRTQLGRRLADRYTRVPSGSEPVAVDWAIGAAMLIANDAYAAVGSWDESFFLYLEDVDFCLRMSCEGWSTVYDPRVELVHTHHRASDSSRGSALRSKARRQHVTSGIRYFVKHRSAAPRRPVT